MGASKIVEDMGVHLLGNFQNSDVYYASPKGHVPDSACFTTYSPTTRVILLLLMHWDKWGGYLPVQFCTLWLPVYWICCHRVTVHCSFRCSCSWSILPFSLQVPLILISLQTFLIDVASIFLVHSLPLNYFYKAFKKSILLRYNLHE